MPTIDIGITRSRSERWVFGVCGGIAEKFGVNPLLVRAAVALAAVVIPGISLVPVLVVYIAAGLLFPETHDGPIDVA